MYYLIGGSGSPNYGDELIMLHWLRFLHEQVLPSQPGAQVVVDNNSVTGSTALFGARYPQVRFQSLLKRIHPDRSKGSFLRNLVHGLGFFSKGHWREHPDLTRAVEDLGSARLVHLYGGGYINTLLWPASGFLLGMLADASTHFGVRLAATGLGVTPLQFAEHDDLQPVRQAIRAFELFEVRDSYGFNRLRQIVGDDTGLLSGQDDAFLYPTARPPEPVERRRLHLSAYRAGNLFERPDVLQWLQQHVAEFDECVYWECAPRMEQEIVEPLSRVVPGLRIASVEELLFTGVPAGPGDHMLTMRYHPHLVASRLGVSGQFLAPSTYYEHKHGAVVHMGSRFRRIDGVCEKPLATAQPLVWRDGGWVALKQALARRLYGLPS